jgi:acyl-CoA thioester hydrolase
MQSPPGMHLAYRGSVNRWECDENDHLNVRFYIEKSWQTLVAGLADLGDGSVERLSTRLELQHVRFLNEARVAAPISGFVAVVGRGAVLTELRNSFTDEVLCATLHRVSDLALDASCELPEHARPRGIADEDLPHVEAGLDEARRRRFRTIGRGVIQANECSAQGDLMPHYCMGRLSDSMPHLWGAFHENESQVPHAEGGAVVEYRLRYHVPLQVGQRFELVSGVYDVGAKTQHFAHLLYNLETGGVSLSAQSVGVRIDLEKRRAVALGDDVRGRLRSSLIHD